MRILYNIFRSEKISAALQQRWLDELPQAKQQQVLRLRHRDDQLRSLLGLQLLKKAMQLTGFTDFSLDSVTFPEHHKPRCLEPVDFSISHSHELVICAVAESCQVGVDTEKQREIDGAKFRRYMSDEQLTDIKANNLVFFDYWAIKEAVMKAADQAHIGNLKNITIHNNIASLNDSQWYLFKLDSLPTFSSYLATDCPNPAIICEQVTLD